MAHRFSDCCEPSRETGADGHLSFLPALLSLVEAPVHLLARLGDLFSLYLSILVEEDSGESPGLQGDQTSPS